MNRGIFSGYRTGSASTYCTEPPEVHSSKDVYRRHTPVAAYAVYSVLAIAAAMLIVVFLSTQFLLAPGDTTELPESRYVISASEPVRLSIPKLSIDAAFEEPLALKDDRTVGIPKAYDTVGWYNGSPTPGELGPSIILGHVDSYNGVAIFYHLGKLEAGDTFTIERADGSKPTFVVEKLERYKQSEFPIDLVYGPIDHAGIRLITCTGVYDHGSLRYSHNLVVYGRLVDLRAESNTTNE